MRDSVPRATERAGAAAACLPRGTGRAHPITAIATLLLAFAAAPLGA